MVGEVTRRFRSVSSDIQDHPDRNLRYEPDCREHACSSLDRACGKHGADDLREVYIRCNETNECRDWATLLRDWGDLGNDGQDSLPASGGSRCYTDGGSDDRTRTPWGDSK